MPLPSKCLRTELQNSALTYKVSRVNKFNRATIEDFKAAIDAVSAADIQGLIVTSGKSTFIVGADITEFGDNFAQGEQAIVDWALPVHEILTASKTWTFLKLPRLTVWHWVAVSRCA